MGKYITWADVSDKYPNVARGPSAESFETAFIDDTEAIVEGLLASHYTVPFSSNNVTVKHLCKSYAYIELATNKDDKIQKLEERFYKQIDMLKAGQMKMITTSGDVIEPAIIKAWSNTQNYHSMFGVDSFSNWQRDSDQLEDEINARD